LYWCAKCFADALKAEPKARGYLIYYDDSEDPNNNQVQEIVLREKERFAQKYRIDEWRVEVFMEAIVVRLSWKSGLDQKTRRGRFPRAIRGRLLMSRERMT
jgi:hypothetical protein